MRKEIPKTGAKLGALEPVPLDFALPARTLAADAMARGVSPERLVELIRVHDCDLSAVRAALLDCMDQPRPSGGIGGTGERP